MQPVTHASHPNRLDRSGEMRAHRLRVTLRGLIAAFTGTLYTYDAAYEPNLTAVKTNNGIAVARYFVGNDPTYSWKRVTPTQVAAIRAAGLGVIVNYEGSADPIGTAQSQHIDLRTYGRSAASAALVDIKACGVPLDGSVACYFSLDNSYDSGSFAAIVSYFTGIHDVMDPYLQVKVYADGVCLNYLVSKGLVYGKQWLAAPTSWPGFNASDPNLAMVQLVGSPVSGTDQNRVVDPKTIGAWWPAGSPYDPAPLGDVLVPFADGSNYASKTDFEAAITRLVNADLNAGTAQGQSSWGGTEQAILGTAQTLINKLNALTALDNATEASVSAQLTAIETAIGKVQAGQLDPTAFVTALETAGVPAEIATDLAQHLKLVAA